MQNTALIVVDCQNDYFQPYGYYGDQYIIAEYLLKNLTYIINWCRENGILIIWIKTKYPVLTQEQVDRIDKLPSICRTHNNDRAPTCCLSGTIGAEFYQPVQSLINKGDIIITKRWYSAFMNTSLVKILADRGINHIIITGVETHLSIHSTVVQAREFNIKTTVIQDCVNAKRTRYHKLGIDKIRAEATKVLKTKELISQGNTKLPVMKIDCIGPDSFVLYNGTADSSE